MIEDTSPGETDLLDVERPANGRMGAPQVTIETITVTRPLKVIAFTCCFITVILMVAATSTADWMLAEGWREGLFMQCISAGADTPLPFKMDADIGCRVARSASYLRGTAALVIIGLIFDFFGTFLTGLGLRSTDPNKKYKYYRVAIYAVQFSKDLANEPPKDGGTIPAIGDLDFDNDGILDIVDDDDDNDGDPDVTDPDDDNDGIEDEEDPDDDNDGIPDEEDNVDDEDADLDGDGLTNDEDDDDDGDGTPDDKDEDDDNDGIDDEDDIDDDNDGIDDEDDDDDDGDNIPDDVDPDDDNDGIDDSIDDDNEGGDLDSDGDDIPDSEDPDDDNDGTPD